ncbi:MAG: hypothetical protein EON55_03125 [Alphaproteobacteria bacterium]|nr:MAG: hypothetical protein EON55_03125 [Alphaproteobacteria bacterium]
MPDDSRIKPATFQFDPKAATALADPIIRARIEWLIRHSARPAAGSGDWLFAAMTALSDDAERRGLMEETLDAELAAYNVDDRERRSAG